MTVAVSPGSGSLWTVPAQATARMAGPAIAVQDRNAFMTFPTRPGAGQSGALLISARADAVTTEGKGNLVTDPQEHVVNRGLAIVHDDWRRCKQGLRSGLGSVRVQRREMRLEREAQEQESGPGLESG